MLIFFAVAAFVQHGQDPFARKELALVYAVPLLALLFTGPGRYSLDARFGIGLGRRRRA
jgi:putative oxidoreductase